MNIVTLEELSNRAWPALQTRFYDGWVLRFSAGYTRRANSVHPLYGSSMDLEEKVDYCESIYGQRTTFKLTDATQPADLEAYLAARDYKRSGRTNLQTRPLDDIQPGTPASPRVSINPTLTHAWLEAFMQLSGVDERYRHTIEHMLHLTVPENAYFSIQRGQEIVAVGLGVIEEGYVSLYDIVTANSHRRQGYGEALVNAIMAWGKSRGAHTAFLQVTDDNEAALALYDKLGFTTAYQYWYRQLDLEG